MPVILLQCHKHGESHSEADAVQDLLQGFGFGFGSAVLAVAASPPDRRALIGQQVDVDELKGAHFVVELPRPGPHRRLLNDVDDV